MGGMLNPSPDSWTQPVDPPLAPVVKAIGQEYPALAPHINSAAVQWAPDPGDGRHMETYPPWERDNPNPGKLTLELYNRKLTGDALKQSLAADALHYLAAEHPETGQAIDPTYRAMRQQMIDSRSEHQRAVDAKGYQESVEKYGETRSHDDWMDGSRADAYMRGGIFPDINEEWPGYLTDEQKAIADRARTYLQTGQPAPPLTIDQSPATMPQPFAPGALGRINSTPVPLGSALGGGGNAPMQGVRG